MARDLIHVLAGCRVRADAQSRIIGHVPVSAVETASPPGSLPFPHRSNRALAYWGGETSVLQGPRGGGGLCPHFVASFFLFFFFCSSSLVFTSCLPLSAR